MKRLSVNCLFLLALSGADAAVAQMPSGPPQQLVEGHCYRIAEDRSRQAAEQVDDYDVDDVGGMIGNGLALSIQRKQLRKRIYLQCMAANGFTNVKFSKPKDY